MIYFYIVLAFVFGFVFGVLTAALSAMSSDKSTRAQIEKLEAENDSLQSDVSMYKHRVGDAMAEVSHLRNQYNKTRAELEILKKNGGDKRPIKKHNVKPNGGSTRKSEKR